MSDILISGTGNPYAATSYTVESNDKNTLTMTDYFQLLATQLQNQDVTNPMDSSELMNQMTQMAMVQSMSSMTDAIKNSTAVNTQTYAAGLIGQEVTVALTEENSYGQETMVGVKYGRVEYVNFTTGNPTFKLEGDSKEYQLAHLLGVGRVPDSTGNGAVDGTTDPTTDAAVEKLVDMIVDRLSSKTGTTDKDGSTDVTDPTDNDDVGKVEGGDEPGTNGAEETGDGNEGGNVQGSGDGGENVEGSGPADGKTEGENVGGAVTTNPDSVDAGGAADTEEEGGAAVSGAEEAPGGGSTDQATE